MFLLLTLYALLIDGYLGTFARAYVKHVWLSPVPHTHYALIESVWMETFLVVLVEATKYL